jgi:hypothetical protein
MQQVIKLRSRLDSVLGVFKGLFSRKDSLIDKADMAVQKLTEYRVSLYNFNCIYLIIRTQCMLCLRSQHSG